MKPISRHLIFLSLFLFTVSAHATVIKIATLSPDGTTWMKKMREAAATISKQTGDRVKFKFYPGGVMGNENSILRKMRIDQLHGAAVTSGSLTRYFIDADIYGMPFLFNSVKEVNYVRSHMDKLIIKGLEDKGLVSFGLAESGFAYILSNTPIKSVSDLRKQKVWIPDTESARDTVKAFSLTPIPLPISDVLSGLQTSLINTIASSPIAAIALQWHTQVKYLTDMPLLYSWGTLVINKKIMDKLQKSDQEIVHRVMSEVFKGIDLQNQKDNISALAALKNQGIKFIIPEPNQVAEWKNLAQKANLQLVK
ncbi:MAG: TRAP transporter substrate-binding protein DctP, partial [Gammaproteobacteria bacterium]|nr:TRAP transporter substrate-binding protein DctP [Gammaproteobacteria bacterium]